MGAGRRAAAALCALLAPALTLDSGRSVNTSAELSAPPGGRVGDVAQLPGVLLYRVRPGDRNEALRYSIRSLVANLEGGVSDVIVIGHVPPWLRPTEALPAPAARSAWQAGLRSFAAAAAALRGLTALLVDDDTFALKPWRAQVLRAPFTLLEHAGVKAGSYRQSMLATDRWLIARGIDRPLSYELHVPLPIDCDAAAPLLAEAVEHPRALQARSVYGNLAQLGGTVHPDVKIDPRLALGIGLGSSGSPGWPAWRPHLARMFPEPSSFER